MYITKSVILLLYRSQLYHILSLKNVKNHSLQVNVGSELTRNNLDCRRKQEEIPKVIPVQLSQGQKAGHGQHGLQTLIFPTCAEYVNTPHQQHHLNWPVHSPISSKSWSIFTSSFFFLLLQSSKVPATVLFLVCSHGSTTTISKICGTN